MRLAHFRLSLPRRVTFPFLALALTMMAAPVSARAQSAQGNLLQNPDLKDGSGGIPAHWDNEAYEPPDSSTFQWYPNYSPAELEISSNTPNDGRWIQQVHLAPGWYHLTGQIKTESVSGGAGGTLSFMEDGIASQPVQGTTDWQTVGLYVKAGSDGADGAVACRLGGYAAMSTGAVFCRNLQLTQVQAPAAPDPSYDLEQRRAAN